MDIIMAILTILTTLTTIIQVQDGIMDLIMIASLLIGAGVEAILFGGITITGHGAAMAIGDGATTIMADADAVNS